MATPSEPIIYRRPLTLSNSVELYWYPPLNNGGNVITSYIIESANIPYIDILPSTDRKSIITNLTTGNTYYFTIKATNINGNGNIASFHYVIPGFKPLYPSNINITNDLSNVYFSFNNPLDIGNSSLTYNTVTFSPLDMFGNISNIPGFTYNQSSYGSNIIDPLNTKFLNSNFSYKCFIQSINTVNDSDKNYFDPYINTKIPTNGLKLWLDPYDRSTLTLSNNIVTKLIDKSGNKSNAFIIEPFGPSYDSSNCLLNFNGLQYLTLPDNTIPSGNSSYSIFMYVSTSNILRNGQWFLYSGSPTSNLSLGGLINSNLLIHSWFGNQQTSNSNISANISYLVEYTYDSGVRRSFLNGSLVGLENIGSRNSTISNNLIATNSNLTANLVGSIGDIIIYNRILSNTERNSVKGYLERKKNNVSLQNVGNLVSWLDATDSDFIYNSNLESKIDYGNKVFTWLDRSRANNNATQSNVYVLPTRRPYIQNNLDVLEFNQSYLTIPSAYYPLDAFMVLKLSNITDQNGILGISPNSNNYSSLSYVSGNKWSIDATSNSLVATTTETSSNFLLMEWSIGNNNNYIRRYGSNIANVTTGTWTLPNNSNIIIGNANGFDFTKRFKGYIGEIIMFNKQLDDGDRYPVEGYLAWKWGLQTQLPSNHPYKNIAPYLFYKYLTISSNITPSTSNIFSPANITGLAMWFDASDSTTYTISSGNLISSWSSKNTYPVITVSQASTNNQPQRVANVRNGLTVLRTSNPNSSTYATLSNTSVASADIATTTSVTIFIVHNPTMDKGTPISYQNVGTNRILFHTPESDGIRWDWAGTGVGYRLNYSLGTGGGATYCAEGFKVECFYISNGVQGYKKNGQLIASQASSTGTFLTTETLTIGAFNPTDTAYYYRTDIGEIVWYKTGLSNIDIQKNEGYLAWKWGLQSNLPSTHPFKYVAPTNDFNPLSISGIGLWLDSSDSQYLTLVSNKVSTWIDKSGNGRDFTQSTAAYRPTYSSTGLNNKPTLLFGNPYICLTRYATQMGTLASSSTLTILYVAQRQNIPWEIVFTNWFIDTGSITTSRFHLSMRYVNSNSQNLWVNNVNVAEVGTTATGGNYIGGFSFAGQNVQSYLTLNGTVSTFTPTVAMPSSINNSNSLFMVGDSRVDGIAAYAISEIIAIDRYLESYDRQRIEGYLAWKWGLQTNLPSTHPFKTFAPTAVFAPSYISSLGLWLDAADTSKLTLSGSNVTAWTDKSTNAYVFNSVTTNYPTISTINSKQAISVVGAATALANTQRFYNSSFSLTNSNYTIFTVAKQNAGSEGRLGYSLMITSARDICIQYGGVNTNFGSYTGNGTSWNDVSANSPNYSVKNAFIGCMSVSSSTLIPYYNGSTQTTKTGTTGSFTGLYIGDADDTRTGYNWNGQIGEIIIYNQTLSTTDRQTVEGYLAWKWGLQSNLPSNHPYKTAAP